MAIFSKFLLSGSTNGRPIKVTATGTPGTLIHTAVATPSFDELWLYAVNTSAPNRDLTIELGGVTSPDDLIEVGIPGQEGLVLVVPGSPLDGSVVIRAFANVADVINIIGWINRITP